MHIIADLQLHSKFSRAVSKEMTIQGIYHWAQRKGIHVLATGDWTHPLWMKEITENLEELGNGLLQLKPAAISPQLSAGYDPHPNPLHQNGEGEYTPEQGSRPGPEQFNPLFLLATEVSCIFTQGGKGRRIHTLIWVPSLDSAQKINKELTKQGCNLLSDGRPIIGLSSIQLAELVFTVEPKALIIPAHAWTPHFGSYGSMSGFDTLAEEFGSYADQIYAVETGLSSNPAMNWQIKELDTRSIVSFSDAHSGPKMGREATVFEFSDQLSAFSYQHLYEAITEPRRKYQVASIKYKDKDHRDLTPDTLTPDTCRILYTIEFYPEEGKYHFTGHRACNIRWGPEETREKGSICPVCGKPLTQGVVQRVAELAARTEQEVNIEARSRNQQLGLHDDVTAYYSKTFPQRPPYIMLVPLMEIIAECIGSSVTSKKTIGLYQKITDHFGGEFNVLLHASKADIATVSGERIAVGITKVRRGDIVIDPGYDGVFGTVKLWKEGEEIPLMDASKKQLSLF